ncbi:hypothetical protein K458DRAFT_419779 [Lentithecium fluviatile CBS 122367]|uniref:Uncharacterized protein n=1 Tax=Lentithecium fluviatile CBS 122367 TaxID=1168545 RepID=A0A6G1IVV4_9PLEO|nr:hypothetical protein K458DRAFT_419779 [Lentithecium fluviatile CBS 122367]
MSHTYVSRVRRHYYFLNGRAASLVAAISTLWLWDGAVENLAACYLRLPLPLPLRRPPLSQADTGSGRPQPFAFEFCRLSRLYFLGESVYNPILPPVLRLRVIYYADIHRLSSARTSVNLAFVRHQLSSSISQQTVRPKSFLYRSPCTSSHYRPITLHTNIVLMSKYQC